MNTTAAAVLTGLVLMSAGCERAHEAETYREARVHRGDVVVTLISQGQVEAGNRLEVKAPIAGRAEQVLVEEGRYVKRGQVLAWVSSSERAALLDAARARGPEEFRQWETLYRPAPILAPLSGQVIARNIEPGQTFTLADATFVIADALIIVAQAAEIDIARIRVGQRARVALDAWPDQSFEASVRAIAFDARIVNNVTTYRVELVPVKPPAFLRSGMSAEVRFVADQHRNVLVLPAAAVSVREGRASVRVPGAEGKAVEQEIQTGLSDGRQVEIVSGLAEGQVVWIPEFKSGNDAKHKRGSPLSPFRDKPPGTSSDKSRNKHP